MKYQSNYDVRQAVRKVFEERCNLCNEDYNTLLIMFETLRGHVLTDAACAEKCHQGIRHAVCFLMMGDHLDGDQVKQLLRLADEIAEG